VFADKKTKKIPIPYITPELIELRDCLQKDLFKISKISGTYKFTDEAKEFWCDWYMNYDETSSQRTCLDRSFDGWYSRKPMYILKMSQITAAAEHSNLIITPADMEYAIKEIESVEHHMSKTFRAVGRSAITADVDLVMCIIKDVRCIAEPKLMQIIWRDIDATKFDNVIGTAMKTGNVVRKYEYEGKRGIFYMTRELAAELIVK
jgi:hypothetical protein